MIAYKTFSEHGGLTTRGVAQTQEKVRSKALVFVNGLADTDDLVDVTESAFRSSWGYCYVSVTVWYRSSKGQ
jgi:hypothetical protein